jgi:predicted small secreted protein
MKKRIIASLSLLFLVAACNTFEGVGKDMKGAGEGLANTASKVKEKM